MSTVLNTYTNGNTTVTIYSDGTKVRQYEDSPCPVHPESMDVKITNACDAGCAYCHEKSVPSGKHADLDKLLEIISNMPAGTEIALGGGNPLSHPEILPFLRKARDRGLIVNMTVNHRHVTNETLTTIVQQRLVHGVGISYSSKLPMMDIATIVRMIPNVVFHVIMGINDVSEVDDLITFSRDLGRDCKILVLGYKQYGRGLTFYDESIEVNKAKWYTQLAKHFRKDGVVISFDNLAIKQLKLQRYFTNDAWSKFYMGDDGQFTMYIDAVEQTFAKSSTSNERVRWEDKSLLDFFGGLRTS
jgi:MoaA/NifB/PqqE/SkfB family radical SAM enzyme